MDKTSENYLIYKKLSKIYNLLEEIYPWATPYFLFHFNKFPKYIFNDLKYRGEWKSGLLFLSNTDKFTIEKPKYINPSILSKNKKFNFIIPNLDKLTKKDVNSFPPIQVFTWKGKIHGILDGMHRLYIANELKEPIKYIEYKSHSYNKHPNNIKIKKLAKEIKNITR